jgi:opacity protein-like surface antigen
MQSYQFCRRCGYLLLVFCILSAGFVVPAQALAADKDKKRELYGFQIAPFVGYRAGGSFEDDETEEEYDLENDNSFGFVLNWPAESYTEWEIYYSQQSTAIKTGDLLQSTRLIDVDIQNLQLGGTYLFESSKNVQPYFGATVGIARFDPQGSGTSSDEFFSFSVGGGTKFWPTRRVGLRIDGRFIGTVIDSDSDIFCQSGPEGSGCIIRNRGEMLWQFEAQAGVVVRF